MIGRSYGTHIDIPKIEVLPNSVAGDHEEGVLRMARPRSCRPSAEDLTWPVKQLHA